ncbi:cytochrome P450-dit2 [Ceratobasidium sp. UAMH 11750]|nr:cytochrome P450-dit2 [Ceratobasidium sp. UAMH 11750]
MAIFDAIALEACNAIIRNQGVTRGRPFEVDIYRYMNSSALELIGQAGLGYSFGSFTGRRDSYSAAIKHLLPGLNLAAPWLPFVVVFENFGSARFRQWVAKTAPFKVIQDLRELVNVQHDQAHEILSARQGLLVSGESLDNATGSGNDVLTLLMRANEKLPKDSQMSKEEMIGHMNSFIFAGHETTSGAVTRVLDMLSTHPEMQDRLRAELTEFMSKTGTEEIDRDKIDTLPYLDAICRETLRLMPPVGRIRRVCLKDTVLPLKYPVNTSKGLQNSVAVPKGAEISVGIEGINHDKDIWGPDADQFVPDRWLDGRASKAEGSPGTYSHMMTFSAGSTACIGFKFAVLEIKILLVRLVTRFKFETSGKEFVWMLTGTQAPYPAEDTKRPSLERKAQLLMKLTEL